MKRTIFILCVAVSAACWGGAAQAQYIFLDTNGDGVSTENDCMSAKGPTQIDVWIRTDQNRDGSKAFYREDPSRQLDMFSYEITLHTSGGTVEWGAYKNQMPSMDFEFRADRTPSYFYTGYLGGVSLPPGKYKVGTLSATPLSGRPAIKIVSAAPLFPPVRTSIGSHCEGKDLDNTLKFTEDPSAVGRAPIETPGDWTGSDGIRVSAAAANAAPRSGSAQQGARPDGVSPNPFNPQGLITFSLRAGGPVRVTLFDTSGKLVKTLLPRQGLGTGSHSVAVDGTDARGKRLASGVYFYRVERPEGEIRGRFVMMK